MSKTKDEDAKLYLIVPSSDGGGPRQTRDESVRDEGRFGDAWRALVGERNEVEVSSEKVTNQIQNYVAVVNEVAKSQAEKEGAMQLSEITLSLTLSASGNIGIASTSAEAGISLIFRRE